MSRILKVITLTITVVFSANIITFAETSSSIQDQINENQNKIDDLENERDKINNEINDESKELNNILDKISQKSNELEAARSEVESYQLKIDEVQAEIDNINAEMANAQNEIESREKIIEEKEKEAIRIKDNIEKRLRNYYKLDIATNYIYLLLKSENILSLLNNIESIFRIINFDKGLIDEAKELQAQLESEKEEISKQLEQIEEGKKAVVAKQEELKEAQKEFIAKEEYHQSQMDELNNLESEKTNIIASLTDQGSDLESQIGDLISYNQALQAELDSIFDEINNGNNPGSGDTTDPEDGGDSGVPGDPSTESFLRPGSGVVTDSYGPRINPVTGEAGFHTGVDLGDPYGAPVAASKSGTVAYSGWISGYGNTIIIDHGGGVQTLYAHNSSLLVGVGESVYRGQTVALVGSTGMSTGPHIHFEIRINGQHVNPMNYI
ncbi:peptidoglycan DD-metalloendopeptidase family protein [Clostridium sp. AL.422]|uniref:murein hydrolase activator EnvC family protein n=1 Tax=Clostridium TaxID=1485 RepID=UPI00293DE2CE|nr:MULTISPECIES: peptidoglycan DD-metalloendopeptidase family protein [unclassified Clostridium]MDV4150915.1 peptidoglycan DD-metalloendopeptidase family protein [Clostridium sp. AL.422]